MAGARAEKVRPGRAPEGGKVPPSLFELFVYNNIVELRDVAYFFAGVAQSPLDGFFRVLASGPQPALELLQDRGRRKDEDAHHVGENLAHLLGALPVDLEQDVQALGAGFGDPFLGGAIAVS